MVSRITSLSPSSTRMIFVVLALLLAGAETAADTSFDLQQYRGKVLVLDFWASWCVPCRRSFPWMNEMMAKYADQGLVIVGVNMDADPALADAFLEEFPANFRIIEDPQGALARKFDVIAMPSSYVIGRNGQLVKRHLGFKVKRQEEYEALLREVLARQ